MKNNLKRRILDKLLWNGNYKLYCSNCNSIIILTSEERDLLYKKTNDMPLRYLRNHFQCCSLPSWLFHVGSFTLRGNPTNIYYFEDIFK